jgi:thiamine biosynthesis lipoprotein
MGCTLKREPQRFKGVSMTIPYCIQVGDPVKNNAEVESIILSSFTEIDAIYNNWNPTSELSQLNCLAANQILLISPKLAAFLNYVDELVKFTEGRFDPTVEPLHKLWKTYLKQGGLPPMEEIEAAKACVGWQKVHCIDRYFWKDTSRIALDLGGIVKGFAVDLLIEKLKDAGFQNLYVEWGGEIRTLGQHPSGRPWKIGIHGLSVIDLTDAAIATSGSYIQNWVIGSSCYTHIVDPRTKEPLQNSLISSVSVIAPTCCEADAIATGLMLFPSKDAAEQWAKEKHYRVFIW